MKVLGYKNPQESHNNDCNGLLQSQKTWYLEIKYLVTNTYLHGLGEAIFRAVYLAKSEGLGWCSGNVLSLHVSFFFFFFLLLLLLLLLLIIYISWHISEPGVRLV